MQRYAGYVVSVAGRYTYWERSCKYILRVAPFGVGAKLRLKNKDSKSVLGLAPMPEESSRYTFENNTIKARIWAPVPLRMRDKRYVSIGITASITFFLPCLSCLRRSDLGARHSKNADNRATESASLLGK